MINKITDLIDRDLADWKLVKAYALYKPVRYDMEDFIDFFIDREEAENDPRGRAAYYDGPGRIIEVVALTNGDIYFAFSVSNQAFHRVLNENKQGE